MVRKTDFESGGRGFDPHLGLNFFFQNVNLIWLVIGQKTSVCWIECINLQHSHFSTNLKVVFLVPILVCIQLNAQISFEKLIFTRFEGQGREKRAGEDLLDADKANQIATCELS